MGVWSIVLIICGVFTLFSFFFCVYCIITGELKDDKDITGWILLVALFVIPLLIGWGAFKLYMYLLEGWRYLTEVWHDGGFRNHYKKEKEREKEAEERRVKSEAERAEYKRIKDAYLNGGLSRTELPRVEDGINNFEFSPEMGLQVDYHNEVREIVYVESEYNDRLNKFFQEHKDLRLYHMYKFVYLPNLCAELNCGDFFHYVNPEAKLNEGGNLKIDSSYPMHYLVYPEDASKIKQGMFFFRGGRDNHGALYIEGDYHPLYEGSDEEIIEQLDAIVKTVHGKHRQACLYCTSRPPKVEEGSTEDYADEMFEWKTINPEVAKLIEEVREKLDKLKEYGLAHNLLLHLLKDNQKLSRLLVTKDLRIILPDYNDMEIKMEPLVKAVYLLFLKHPEGILFKHLPDYRKELTEIYVKLKPYGLSDRVVQSIEDVTNPLLNSINEKCARIRGAFVGQFDDHLAKHYYIDGMRGEAKKIALPRDLVVWE